MSRFMMSQEIRPGVTLTGPAEGVTQDGRGVLHVNGATLFVAGLLPGEKGRVQVEAVHPRRGYAEARLLQRYDESPERVLPRCPVFGRCGGCQLQHWSAEAQQVHKRQVVADAFRRIAHLSVDVEETVNLTPWAYRNKIEMPVVQTSRGTQIGYFASHSHQIVNVETCPIAQPPANRVLAVLQRLIRQYHIAGYDETRQNGELRHVVVRVGERGREVLVILVTRVRTVSWLDAVVKTLVDEIDGLVGVVQNVQPVATNVILGSEWHLCWGRSFLNEHLGDLHFHLSAGAFFQVNPPVAEKMYNAAQEALQCEGTETLVDLYCGVGTTTLWMASQVKWAVGVESNRQAVQDAQANAVRNHVANVDFYADTAAHFLMRWVAERQPVDRLLLDPPRKGAEPAVLDAILTAGVPRLVYISCNPQTLARDAARLSNAYRVTRVQPFDLFPQTAHIETVVGFEHR
ncbi:MAG: 23S rRNA (uracil(1939)-C(5))-methyltransferase RlmD [Firmicutes bacterium]|nr:23S rRNA (uracil(1939)-C(5))-methyltransferase RlmD [Bacillota bacterium]